MATEPKIIWLASFPKSGNTWTRLFLHALKSGKNIEDLNKIDSIRGISSAKVIHENYSGIDIDDIPQIQIQRNRKKIFEFWNNDLKEEVVVKSHDTPYFMGHRIIPYSVTKKVILIVRNPFDIVASLANHNNCSIEKSVQLLCNEGYQMAKGIKHYNNQVAQHPGSWSTFYIRWLNAFPNKVSIYRYEDLQNDTFNEFQRLVKDLGWDYSANDIERAIAATNFKKVKALEQKSGFREKPPQISSFFRSGSVGNWKNEITNEMANELIDCHFQTLLDFNYIDEQRSILV